MKNKLVLNPFKFGFKFLFEKRIKPTKRIWLYISVIRTIFLTAKLHKRFWPRISDAFELGMLIDSELKRWQSKKELENAWKKI